MLGGIFKSRLVLLAILMFAFHNQPHWAPPEARFTMSWIYPQYRATGATQAQAIWHHPGQVTAWSWSASVDSYCTPTIGVIPGSRRMCQYARPYSPAYFIDQQKGWVSGHDGVVLHSSDGGENWIKQLDGYEAADGGIEYYQTMLEAEPDNETYRVMLDELLFAQGQGADRPFFLHMVRERTGRPCVLVPMPCSIAHQ